MKTLPHTKRVTSIPAIRKQATGCDQFRPYPYKIDSLSRPPGPVQGHEISADQRVIDGERRQRNDVTLGSLVTTCALAIGMLATSGAHAAEPDLLTRALNCNLKTSEVASLRRDLAARRADLRNPVAYGALPTFDLYALASPVTAFGYASREIIVTHARILLVVPGARLAGATKRLRLETGPWPPARRARSGDKSIVAYQMQHKLIEGKLLIGCEYANAAAVHWMDDDMVGISPLLP